MGDGVSMEKIRNLSLKKTMVLYTILSLIVTFFLSVSIIEIAGQIQEEVWWKYVDQDEYYQAMNDRNENFEHRRFSYAPTLAGTFQQSGGQPRERL